MFRCSGVQVFRCSGVRVLGFSRFEVLGFKIFRCWVFGCFEVTFRKIKRVTKERCPKMAKIQYGVKPDIFKITQNISFKGLAGV